MAWDDFIKATQYDPASFDFARFVEQANREHTDEVSVRDAKVRQLTESDTAKDAEISRLKAANYDLLMSKPAEQPPGVQDTPPDPDTIVSVADLFKKE